MPAKQLTINTDVITDSEGEKYVEIYWHDARTAFVYISSDLSPDAGVLACLGENAYLPGVTGYATVWRDHWEDSLNGPVKVHGWAIQIAFASDGGNRPGDLRFHVYGDTAKPVNVAQALLNHPLRNAVAPAEGALRVEDGR